MKTTPSHNYPRRVLFVREGRVPYTPSRARDPFETWISLMEAVEALCPRWPARAHRITGEFKL
jgi:hypothetical protein